MHPESGKMVQANGTELDVAAAVVAIQAQLDVIAMALGGASELPCAADEIGGERYQRVKPAVGDDGVAVDVSSAAPMPIIAGEGARDDISNALQTIAYPHHEIHEGDAFTCQVQQLVSDTNDRTALAFKTAAGTKRVHMFAKGTASSPAEFIIREACTVADNQGATQAVLNRQRASANATTVIDTSQNPDTAGAATYFAEADQAHITENGTLIYIDLLAAEKKKGGGDTRGEAEFVLKPDTQYAFYMKSLNNDDNYHGLVLDWYEHTDSN